MLNEMHLILSLKDNTDIIHYFSSNEVRFQIYCLQIISQVQKKHKYVIIQLRCTNIGQLFSTVVNLLSTAIASIGALSSEPIK
jgi:hypothetical protein